MKYKGFSIYVKERKRAASTAYLEYRIVPPKGLEWPEDLPKSGQGLDVGMRKAKPLTIEQAQRVIDKVENRQYNLDIGRAVNATDPISDLFPKYVEWGKVYGGKKKLGWNKKTLRDAPKVLAWWALTLNLSTVSDIKLIHFESAVARMVDAGVANKTIINKANYLKGFTKWAKQRQLLSTDPLAGWASLDPSSKEVHGNLDPWEIRQLLDVVTLKRRIIYGLAYFCRARRGAIASLKVRSMDWAQGGFTADYLDIKSRDKKKAFVPVPQPLLGWIWEDSQGRGLDETLTSISKNHAIKYFRRDLKRAGLALEKDGLQRTFHGLGAGTATHVEAAGVSEFAIADLMGHSDVNTTRIYLRQRIARIQSAQRPLVLGIYPEIGETDGNAPAPVWHGRRIPHEVHARPQRY